MNKKIGLVWLHNDLRLHDNPTLHRAAKHCDELLVLYATYDFPSGRGQCYYFNHISDHRRRFLHETLGDLQLSLQQLGNTLLCKENISLVSLVNWLQSQYITDIFHSQTADYDHNERLALVAQRLPEVRWHEANTATLFADLPMVSLPKVFTQFRQHIEKNAYLLRQKVSPAQTPTPQRLPPLPASVDNASHYVANHVFRTGDGFIGGETRALAHVA